ncbi:MAG TPA: DUF6807 family protein, partial [Vicinamibacteria bacterium]|nr:DUF6807 family protein [Vicinamibacteria bacterium]
MASDWVMPDGSTVLKETTRFVFAGGEGRRSVDRVTTLAAASGRVVFKDNKEGVFAVRVARALEEPSKRPEVFTDASGKPTAVPVLDNAGVNGVYTSSEGVTGGAVWGTRGRWLALSGRVDGEDVVLLMLDHPKNPGYPTHWHARGYGLFSANPLGASVFSEGKERLDQTIEKAPRASSDTASDPPGAHLGREGGSGLEGVRGRVPAVGTPTGRSPGAALLVPGAGGSGLKAPALGALSLAVGHAHLDDSLARDVLAVEVKAGPVPVAGREHRELARVERHGRPLPWRREELDVLRGVVGLARREGGHGRDTDRLLAANHELDVDVAPVGLEPDLLGRA